MNRLLTTFLFLSFSLSTFAQLPKVKHLIDTHIHLYDTEREGGVPWPPVDDEVLYKPHLPAEFERVAKPAGVTGVVIVEASDKLADNDWVLKLTEDKEAFFVALVGNIDPTVKDFRKELKPLRKNPRFVGIRARRAGGVDLADKQVLKNFKHLSKQGLSVDILMNGKGAETLEQVADMAAKLPELRIVVDHVLGYNIDGKAPSPTWIAAATKLAANKNVYCKISGLYQRCVDQPASKDPAHYRSLLDILWNEFGSERLIYGSNWPCTKKSGDYTSFVTLVNAYASEKGQEACENLFWKNANRAYKLGLK